MVVHAVAHLSESQSPSGACFSLTNNITITECDWQNHLLNGKWSDEAMSMKSLNGFRA